MVEARELYKYYGERRALGPVTFTIQPGEIVGFLGLNGAGKTTCLRILAGDLLPSGGRLRIDGEDVTRASLDTRARVGFLPDRPPLYPDMTVGAFLGYVARLRGLGGAAADRAVADAAERTQVADVLEETIAELSHGYQQRVGIAQAIVHAPRLLILDEPFTGLDPVQIVEMRGLIARLRELATVLVSSHILSEVSETCDRILVIRDGEIVASGSQAELSGRLLEGVEVELDVRGAVEAVMERLRALAGAEATVVAAHDGVVTVRVASPRDVREEAVAALVHGGLGVLRVQRTERELERVFLELSRGRRSEAAA